MSDSEDFTVTYTKVSSLFEDLSNIGSLGFVIYGYDSLSMHLPPPDYVPRLEHLPFPNYVPGPEHPPLLVYVPYVPKPAYPEFMTPEDDVLQEDSGEDDEDPEEDPADYPTDRDDDDEEEESFGDDADVDEEDKDEEEEHLALADYVPPSQTVAATLPFPSPPPLDK
nr:hypothetical protein [Tanacetum cinerariifolium]